MRSPDADAAAARSWSSPDLPELVCPCCRRSLAAADRALRCGSCERSFPIVAGIPDLRIAGDPYLSLDDDRAKAEALSQVNGGLAEVVAAYWERTPEVPLALARRYADRALDAARRAGVHLDRLAALALVPAPGPRPAPRPRLLDLGCGTGGLLVAATQRGMAAVGVDIALRWLVVAQRGLSDHGIDAPLVAADGALLPFHPGSFDVVTCIETLEHTRDQSGLLHSCLAAGSGAYLVTANRLSLAPEPTVGLWGVGYLPRRRANTYVRWRKGTDYRHFRALSVSRLRAMLGPDALAVVRAAVLPAPAAAPSVARRIAQCGYDGLRRRGGPGLELVAPYLEVATARPRRHLGGC